MNIKVENKIFSFSLKQALKTSQGYIKEKKGWILRIENDLGKVGWGEISPLSNIEIKECKKSIELISSIKKKECIEELIPFSPNSVAFGLGSAMAEIDGLNENNNTFTWLKAPKSAYLLNSHFSPVKQIEILMQNNKDDLTIKWKAGIKENVQEQKIFKQIQAIMPSNWKLRIDVNGGWERSVAKQWVELLSKETRLEWLEQPLARNDYEGHLELSKIIPIALDESLSLYPNLRKDWKSWQIRRPIFEGDPRLLIKELKQGYGYRVISTGFETGIGYRWVNHLAALQNKGPTPIAPGLAPGWKPSNQLFASNPCEVWNSL